MTREELNKRTVRELIAYYEELTGEPYGRNIKRKEQLISDIKSHIRAKERGTAFSKYA